MLGIRYKSQYFCIDPLTSETAGLVCICHAPTRCEPVETMFFMDLQSIKQTLWLLVFIVVIGCDIIKYRDNFSDDNRDKNVLISPSSNQEWRLINQAFM